MKWKDAKFKLPKHGKLVLGAFMVEFCMGDTRWHFAVCEYDKVTHSWWDAYERDIDPPTLWAKVKSPNDADYW